MRRSRNLLLAVALLTAGGGAAIALAHDHGADPKSKRELHAVLEEGGERIELDDLDELEVGESRDYRTNSGKRATVTRDDKGYEVDFEGKKLRVGDETFAHPGLAFPHGGHDKLRMKRIELDGDGEARKLLISREGEHDLLVLDEELAGPHGEHRAFERFGGPLPLLGGVDRLLERLEQSEKFRSLDDATQELVREAIRESSPEPEWLRLDEAGPGAMKVIVRERSSGEDDAEN